MSPDRNEPVLTRVAIVGAIGAILHLAVRQDWISLDASAEAETVALIDMLSLIVAAFLARAGVFPQAKVAAYSDADQGRVVAGPASPIPDGTPVAVENPDDTP